MAEYASKNSKNDSKGHDGIDLNKAMEYGGIKPIGENYSDFQYLRLIGGNAQYGKDLPNDVKMLYFIMEYAASKIQEFEENAYGRDGQYDGQPVSYRGEKVGGQKGAVVHGCPDCKCGGMRAGGLEHKLGYNGPTKSHSTRKPKGNHDN